MQLEAAVLEDAIVRLQRIEGQVGGIIRMIEAGRECRDVVRQVAAASKALDQVGFKLVASGLRACLADERAAKRAGYSEQEMEKLLMSLA